MIDAARGPVYRDRLTTVADKWLFLGFLLVGVAGIVALKLLGWPQLIVTAWPVGCMLLYLAIVLLQPEFRSGCHNSRASRPAARKRRAARGGD